ncbi:hypothetical protein Ddye_028079 [Dipteronia dyeriana]|uniref:Uncharacterized protein n=1 Tax=Dipteronia dyeriana TaxID=168575 RepID=A0AAD9TQB0_9ROSI|nr:hypothetical protein Ddye_028079 [Dipteronia dyeriana]
MLRRRFRMADATDEYIKIGESITIESLKRFCRAVVEEFVGKYLRSPNTTDVARLLHIGQYAGRSGSLTIILEDVDDYDMWICHAYFGLPGTNNGINVLEASHLFPTSLKVLFLQLIMSFRPRLMHEIGLDYFIGLDLIEIKLRLDRIGLD